MLQDLKEYLSSPPLLVTPKSQESLLLYLAATNQVVSGALVVERKVDDEVAAVTGPDAEKLESSPAMMGADKSESAQEDEQEKQQIVPKKMVQRQVYFVSTRGLDQGILECTSCVLVSLWPPASRATTFKHIQSLSSIPFCLSTS